MHSEYRPTIDRKRERFLSEPVRSIGYTSERARDARKRYLTTVPESEREHAQAWLDTYGDLLHSEPMGDTIDRALGTSDHPLSPVVPSETGEAWQAPVTLVTHHGEPVDLCAVWSELREHLMGDPIDDRSEHSKRADHARERRTVTAVERGSLYFSTSTLGTTLDVTVMHPDGTGVTHLVGEQRYHVEQAHKANASKRKRESTLASNKRKRDERKRELAKVRAERAERERERERAIAHDKATFDRQHATTYGS